MSVTKKQPINDFRGYMGNMAIKRHGVKVNIDPAMAEEWLKCEADPLYFAEHHMNIINADGDVIKIKLHDFQRDVIDSLHKNQKTIVLTCRQAGKTTSICAYILWFVLFNETKNVALLAQDVKTARETLKRIKTAYELLPKWLQQGVVEWNKGSVEFENKCRIFAGPCTKDTFRGFSIQLLMIDEVAAIENWEDFFASAFNTMSNSKKYKIAMTSTPKGLNHFYDYWIGAIEKNPKKNNGYFPIKVTWRSIPGRDEAWKQSVLGATNFDLERFAQEHECEFLGSSGTLIAGWRLKQLAPAALPPISIHNGSTQFERPIDNHRYSVTCDVSRGRGLDYSTIQVVDVTVMPYKQVFTFRDNMMTPLDFAEVVYLTAKSYNNATVLIELNDLGEQVADNIFYEYEYDNLLFTESAGNKGKRISAGFGKGRKDKGLTITKTTKAVGCAILKLLVEQGKLEINDRTTITELATFSRKLDSYAAEAGKHDDMVMPLVVFAWLSDQEYFREYTDINTLDRLREKNEDDMMEELTPFGFYDGGPTDDPEEIQTVPSLHHWMHDEPV